MIETISTVLYFIVAIVVLVTVHEFGHYLAAIWTKTRAEVFSVGMGRRLFGWNKIDGFTVGELSNDKDYGNHTDWRISLMPIGGFVKISGMVDESMEEQEASSEPKPYEFRSKSALQKIFILSAGVIFNILLALILFIAVNINTEDVLYDNREIGFVDPYSNAYAVGFRAGDVIKEINGEKPEHFNAIINSINRDDVGNDRRILIDRSGERVELAVPYDSVLKYIAAKEPIEFVPTNTMVVFGEPLSGSNAEKAGLQLKDTVRSINGTEIKSLNHFRILMEANRGQDVTIEVKNDGLESKTVKVGQDSKIGIQIGSVYTGPTIIRDVPFGEAITRGWDATINMFKLFFQSIKQIIEGSIDAKQAIGGPIMIAKQAKTMGDMGFAPFLIFLASLSVSLAIINILPLPVLDGGHILIVIIEKIIGREISESVKMRIQAIGMVLMFLLMAVIIYMDITR